LDNLAVTGTSVPGRESVTAYDTLGAGGINPLGYPRYPREATSQHSPSINPSACARVEARDLSSADRANPSHRARRAPPRGPQVATRDRQPHRAVPRAPERPLVPGPGRSMLANQGHRGTLSPV